MKNKDYGKKRMNNPVSILRHNDEMAPHFKSLNEEWLTRYFRIEPIDSKVLSQPQKIIADGGQILYAQLNQKIVGCVALKHHGDGVFELTKMAVTHDCQGHGIGTKLLQACIDYYHDLNANELYLETHSSLENAIHLYAKYGFKKQPHPFSVRIRTQ